MGRQRPCKPRVVQDVRFWGASTYKYGPERRVKLSCQWCIRTLVLNDQRFKQLETKHKKVHTRTGKLVTDRDAMYAELQDTVGELAEAAGWLFKATYGWGIAYQTEVTYCICPMCKPAKLTEMEWGRT